MVEPLSLPLSLLLLELASVATLVLLVSLRSVLVELSLPDAVEDIASVEVADVVVEGTATLPPPVTLPLSALLAPGDGPQPYESALVRIESATVTDPEVCSGEFALTAEVRVDDLFLGGNAPSPSIGATYSAIIGPLRFTEDAFDVAPRSLADLVP